MVFNIVVNVILIPRYGAIGAALSAGISNLILTIASIAVASRIIKLPKGILIKKVMQLVVSTVAMGVAVWYTDVYMNFIAAIIVGAAVYTGMLYVTKIVRIEQFKEMMTMLKR